jgi:hypothetical protein
MDHFSEPTDGWQCRRLASCRFDYLQPSDVVAQNCRFETT